MVCCEGGETKAGIPRPYSEEYVIRKSVDLKIFIPCLDVRICLSAFSSSPFSLSSPS